MTTFKIAHIKEQGQDMIIVPVNPTIGRSSQHEQNALSETLQIAASLAGLKGTVAMIWRDGNRIGFIAPRPWHPFFQSRDIYNRVLASLNLEMTVAD
jgi:hypothetical protein